MSTLALAALLAWVGSRLGRSLAAPGQGRAYRLALYLVTGIVALHLLQTALDLAGVRWTRASLLLGLAALGGGAELAWRLGSRRRRDPPQPVRLPSDLGWGDAAASAGLVVFALFAPTLWITTPDWVYHWGLKAHRYFLAGEVDLGLLTAPWGWTLHPDYPNLLPDLYAATAVLAGRFAPAPLMLWSVLLYGCLLVASRELLRQLGVDRGARQAATALLGLLLGGFALHQLTAGGADWALGLALVLALPALLAWGDGQAGDATIERQLGLAAALAVGSKIEGVVLGAALVGIFWLARGRRLTLGAAWRSAALPAAVVLPFLAVALRHHLFLDYDGGGPALGHLGAVAAALLEEMTRPAWSGLGAAVWLPVPLLFSRRARAFAAVACLQLGFYGYVYLSAAADHRFYVLSTFPRLMLHIIPAALVTGAAVLWGERLRAVRPATSGTGS